jgi:hypothetical protein
MTQGEPDSLEATLKSGRLLKKSFRLQLSNRARLQRVQKNARS